MICTWVRPILFTFELIPASPHSRYLFERCRSTEHITHVGDLLCHVAFGQFLIIRFGTTEHITHAHEFVNITLGQVPVEGIGLTEHEDHAGDLVSRSTRRSGRTV